jgi:hypothetical protein
LLRKLIDTFREGIIPLSIGGNTNRPLPLVAKDTKYAKDKILESREKAAFQKHCHLPVGRNQTSPSGIEPFAFRIFPAGDKISSW